MFRNEWTSSAEIYLPNGKLPQVGDFFTNKKMAETYIRIINEAEAKSKDIKEQIQQARNIWSKGFVAEEIEHYCKNNTNIAKIIKAASLSQVTLSKTNSPRIGLA